MNLICNVKGHVPEEVPNRFSYTLTEATVGIVDHGLTTKGEKISYLIKCEHCGENIRLMVGTKWILV